MQVSELQALVVAFSGREVRVTWEGVVSGIQLAASVPGIAIRQIEVVGWHEVTPTTVQVVASRLVDQALEQKQVHFGLSNVAHLSVKPSLRAIDGGRKK